MLEQVTFPRPAPVTLAPCHVPELPSVDLTAPAFGVLLPDGRIGHLDGSLWPQVAFAQASARMRPSVSAGARGDQHAGLVDVTIRQVTRREANELLCAFEHPLGEYNRRFGEMHFALMVDGEAVAVACSSSVRSKTVAGGIPRRQVVELARVARHPDHPRAMRVMLRCWTDWLAPAWERKYPDWKVTAAISYALPGKAGNVYRFDGWTDLGFTNPWGGSTGWGNASKANQIADGRKRVWLYRYDQP